jgi:hypothetical protein
VLADVIGDVGAGEEDSEPSTFPVLLVDKDVVDALEDFTAELPSSFDLVRLAGVTVSTVVVAVTTSTAPLTNGALFKVSHKYKEHKTRTEIKTKSSLAIILIREKNQE